MMRALLAVVAAAALAGCGSAPAPRLYALDASGPGTVRSAASPLTVYVGAVVVPEAIDRPQLVVRSGASEVAPVDGHRWAEPLKIAIGRVLAASLSRDLGTPDVGAYPGTALSDAAYRVKVEVQRFDSLPGSAVTLDAVWSVRRVAGDTIVSGRTVFTQPVAGGYEALAVAHGRALDPLGRDIAGAIRKLEER